MFRTSHFYPLQPTSITFIALLAAGCGGAGTEKNPHPSPSANSSLEKESTETTLAAASVELETLALMTGSTSGDPTSFEGTLEAQQVAAFANDVSGQAITTTTVFCGGNPAVDNGNGSITTENNDVDPAGPSAGDTVTVTFADCNQFGRVISGSRTYTVNTGTGTPGAGAFTLDTTRSADITSTSARGVRTDVSTASTKIDDTGTVLTVTSTGTSTGTSTPTGGVADTRTDTFSVDSTQDQTNQTFTRSFKSSSQSTAGGTQTIETITPLSGTIDSAPTAGVIKITALDPTTNVTRITTITALPGDLARIEVDQDGDGVIDSTIEAPWKGIIGIKLGGNGNGNGNGNGKGNGKGGGGVGQPITTPPGTTPPVTAPPVGGGLFSGGGARGGVGF